MKLTKEEQEIVNSYKRLDKEKKKAVDNYIELKKQEENFLSDIMRQRVFRFRHRDVMQRISEISILKIRNK